MALSPRTRQALAEKAERRNLVKQFYVYRDDATNLGGVLVEEKEGHRVVTLNQQQGQFFMDQGVIGLVPHNELSDHAKNALKQFRRTPPVEEQGQATKAASRPEDTVKNQPEEGQSAHAAKTGHQTRPAPAGRRPLAD